MIAGFTTDMCLGTLCGWRIPFIVVAAPGFLMALLFWFTTKETPRGNTEESLKELIESGKAYTAKINWSEHKLLFKNKTNILIILQSLPGIVPWSVLLVYLNDFLAQEKGYTVQAATTLVMLLGVGILSGNIVGGFIGDIIYRKSKKWLPIACGMMVLVGVILTLMIVLYPSQANVQNPEYIPLIVLSVLTGIIIAPAGTMLWAMLINVNLPEVRGSASSLFNMVDTLGKGFGPFFVSQIIVALGRQQAFVISILFWVPSALIFFLLAFTLPKDVEALETVLKERAKNLT
jgi:predicted MFS family arabinose efflux permease